MAGVLTPLDLLNLVLVVGFLAALFGWAGGKGALRAFSARIGGLEDAQEVFDVRLKKREGAAGQVATQKRKTQLQAVDAEAERLAAALSRGRGVAAPRALDLPDDEEAAEAQLMQEAKARGLLRGGKAS